jgi:hypothetical protein
MRQVLLQGHEKYLIYICCVCGEVRDDVSGDGTWNSLEEHMRRYGFLEGISVFSHTFCPPCFMVYQKQFGLDCERGTPVLRDQPGV